MGPSAGSVILREHYVPDDSDDESSARAASNATSTEGSQLIVLSSGEEDLDQEPTTQEDDSLDARSEASATGSEPEVLIAEEIPDFDLEDVLPATQTAIFMHLPGIRQAEYDWLRKHGVSEEVAGFCLEGTSQGPRITNENRKTAITNHNFLHRALAQDALRHRLPGKGKGRASSENPAPIDKTAQKAKGLAEQITETKKAEERKKRLHQARIAKVKSTPEARPGPSTRETASPRVRVEIPSSSQARKKTPTQETESPNLTVRQGLNITNLLGRDHSKNGHSGPEDRRLPRQPPVNASMKYRHNNHYHEGFFFWAGRPCPKGGASDGRINPRRDKHE
ncbi:hypothetical protein N7467_002018 [Penicillium canescens]|nr:hypothetical protein N7467_002018 [Penicillium canescens]